MYWYLLICFHFLLTNRQTNVDTEIENNNDNNKNKN